MQENRSFDHYFGAYPGVRGFDDRDGDDLGVFAQVWPGGSAKITHTERRVDGPKQGPLVMGDDDRENIPPHWAAR
jgi:phospholipase C